jgi:antitoxin (DNA-binding transcriptional repressor) of toxin-antitoxin stability system
MNRYTVAQARQRFSEILDAAESGKPIVIERRGVCFVMRAERPRTRRRRRRKSLIEYMDPAVAAGRWTWDLGPEGLRFVPRRSR